MAKKTVKSSNYSPLPVLIEFLNVEADKLGEAWCPESDVQRRLWSLLTPNNYPWRSKSLPNKPGGAATGDFTALQKELRDDITFLLQPSDLELTERLGALKQKIDKAVVSRDYYYNVEEFSESKEYRRPTVVDVAGKRLVIEEVNIDDSPRSSLYRILGDSFNENTFSKIKICRNCEKLFLQEGRRLTYCSTTCETTFNNKRRTRSGYFRDWQRDKRKEEKKKRNSKGKRQMIDSKSFERFLRKAGSKSASKDETDVFPIVKKLGGWKIVKPWLAAFKDGESAAGILKTESASMKAKIKTVFGRASSPSRFVNRSLVVGSIRRIRRPRH